MSDTLTLRLRTMDWADFAPPYGTEESVPPKRVPIPIAVELTCPACLTAWRATQDAAPYFDLTLEGLVARCPACGQLGEVPRAAFLAP